MTSHVLASYDVSAVVSTVLITRVAKDALEKAIEEHDHTVEESHSHQEAIVKTSCAGRVPDKDVKEFSKTKHTRIEPIVHNSGG